MPIRTPSLLGEATIGVAHPWSNKRSTDGVQFDVAFGGGEPGSNTGAGPAFSYRRAGDTQEVALAIHTYGIVPLPGNLAAFGRISLNVLEWDRVGTKDRAGIGSPAFEVGVGLRDDIGPCLTVSARRDLRFGEDDDTFLGVSLGFCALISAHTIR